MSLTCGTCGFESLSRVDFLTHQHDFHGVRPTPLPPPPGYRTATGIVLRRAAMLLATEGSKCDPDERERLVNTLRALADEQDAKKGDRGCLVAR